MRFPPPTAGLIGAVLLGGCAPAVLDPAGPVAAGNKSILIGSVVIMLAIVVPTIVATLGFAWWFRASNKRARYLPDWTHSGQVELVVWAIPVLTIGLLGGVAWIGSHLLDPGRPLTEDKPALQVQVVSLDWKWLFIYPEQRVAAVNQLVIPAGTPVRFTMTSGSVLNTFFIPQLGSMIYTMNGMTSTLWLQADAPGTYRGMSAHFSGDHFPDMHFEVRSVAPDQFTAWVDQAKGGGRPLDRAAYDELARQGTVEPATFRSADPDLFGQVVGQHIPPAAGPAPALREGKR